MNKEYNLDKEYNVVEIIRYNLRMWWLAIIFGVLCAGILGGYKYKANHQFVEQELYENIQQAVSTVYVKTYSDETSVERVGTLIKIAYSNRTYDKFIENTGYNLSFNGYQNLFEPTVGEVSDIMTLYLNYPSSYEEFRIEGEEDAKEFLRQVIAATDEVSREMIGENCIESLDAPYTSTTMHKLEAFSITREDFRKGVLKGALAGFVLGVIVEVVLYTFWMLLYKKPKNAEEIRQGMEVPVIDSLKKGMDDEESFKKLALFLQDDGKAARTVCCMPVSCPKKDAALKLAMSMANEQKRTLYVDLAESAEENSISAWVLGEGEEPKPQTLNSYLDSVRRNVKAEKNFNLVMNRRFADYLAQKSSDYDCVVINVPDVTASADAYAVAKLCDKTFAACGRKEVKNETLYRVRNTADVSGIRIEGVLVYES